MESTVTSFIKPLDPERWVEEHADVLYRHALSRLGDTETAKDLVQETFLAACRSLERYAGKASERTWLFRILRNKIADHYRRRRPVSPVGHENELAELEANQFVQSGLHHGGWRPANQPQHWKSAEESLTQSEFWAVIQQCTGKLPRTVATAFLMREVEETSSAEICSTLNITQNHLGVLLHRARLAMRRCLELNWFRDQSRSDKQTHHTL